MATRGKAPAKQAARAEDTALAVVLFEDMQASTALKRAVTRRAARKTADGECDSVTGLWWQTAAPRPTTAMAHRCFVTPCDGSSVRLARGGG